MGPFFLKATNAKHKLCTLLMCSCVWSRSNLLLEDVHRRLVGLELLVLQEDLPPQLQRRRQVRVVAEVALEEEARHQTLPKHRLKEGVGGEGKGSTGNGWARHQWTAADDAVSAQSQASGEEEPPVSKQQQRLE